MATLGTYDYTQNPFTGEGFQNGGFVRGYGDPYTVTITDEYGNIYSPLVTSGGKTKYTVMPTRTVVYRKTDAVGNEQDIIVDVQRDGTIHVDPEAFTLLVEQIGFKKIVD